MQNKKNFLQENGYLILSSVIDAESADSIKTELKTLTKENHYIGTLKRHIVAALPENISHPKFRFKDLHISSPRVREAVFSVSILDSLFSLASESLLAFQNLGFIHGSGLRIHRDSNYVDVQGLNAQFYGCWIALEDIQEGSGELIYYPGSHLLPNYEFSENSKHWVVSRDGIYANEACHDWLEKQMADHGIAPQRFMARKGDCIIWHGDLVHAGAPIRNKESTRYSLVTHFCSMSARPRYLRAEHSNQIIQFRKDCYFSSAHYDLTGIQNVYQLDAEPIKPRVYPLAEA